MNWEAERADWPLAAHSRFVKHDQRRWHVQDMGEGPVVLFLHGAAASTHSFADLIPCMAGDFRCVALDLPGHGFTDAAPPFNAGLTRVAKDIADLLDWQGLTPEAIVGHSAGAAVALAMADRPSFTPKAIVSLNGAFAEFDGIAGVVFPVLAKLLALNPFAPVLFSATTTERNVAQLLSSTGSQMSPAQTRMYYRLIRDRRHVSGVLSMMAAWDLRGLGRRMPGIDVPCLLLAGDRDGIVAPKVSRKAVALLPDACLNVLSGLGHLMHEEAPERIAEITRAFIAERL